MLRIANDKIVSLNRPVRYYLQTGGNLDQMEQWLSSERGQGDTVTHGQKMW